jgi:hypothetical protein
VQKSLDDRVHACWINPNAQPQAAAVPPPSTAGSAVAAPAAAAPAPATKKSLAGNHDGTDFDGLRPFRPRLAPSKRHRLHTSVPGSDIRILLPRAGLRMSEPKGRWQILDSSMILDSTFAN